MKTTTPPSVRALTLHQPWASAMAIGLKRIETRSWSTRYRGPVVIHAALAAGPDLRAFWADTPMADRAAFSAAGYSSFRTLPFMLPVAVGELIDIRPVESVLVHGADAQEERWGDYSPGRFAWIFRDIRRVDYTARLAISGHQGLWHWRHGPLEPAPSSRS